VHVRGLTFELSGRHRQGAWPVQRMMTLTGARAKRLAGGGPLERRVRPHSALRQEAGDQAYEPDAPTVREAAVATFLRQCAAAWRERGVGLLARGQQRVRRPPADGRPALAPAHGRVGFVFVFSGWSDCFIEAPAMAANVLRLVADREASEKRDQAWTCIGLWLRWMNSSIVTLRFSCGLTFELSGGCRRGAWAARRMMTLAASRPKCLAGGRPLERTVRPHRAPASCACLLSEAVHTVRASSPRP